MATRFFRNANRAAGGKLRATIVRLHAQEKTYDAIARELHDRFGVTVSRETVRKWVKEWDQERAARKEEEAAA